jgi:hypothetical protein
MVGESIEVVTAEARVRDIVAATLGHSITKEPTIPEAIMEAIRGTIIEAMPHMAQLLGFFLVGRLLEAFTVHSGGRTMLYPYLPPITIHTISIPILLLLMWLRFLHLRPLPPIRKDLR